MTATFSSHQETWTQASLGQFCGQRGQSIEPNKTPDSKFELYSVPSFPDGQPEIVLGKEVGSSKQVVESNSVLLCKINPRINRAWVVGNFSRYTKIASTEWIVFPPDERVMPKFLAYFLRQNSVRDFLASNVSGVGGSLMRVKPSTLRDFPFTYPDRETQHSIVAEIEKQFSRLDEAVASLKRTKVNLKRYKAAVLKAAVEGKLTGAWRKQHPNVEPASKLLERILAERRAKWNQKGKYQEPVSPDADTLPSLPKSWIWTSLGQMFEVCVGATPSRGKPEYWNGTIPWVSSGEVAFCRIRKTREHITQKGLANSSTHLHPQGTVLLGMIGEGKTRGQAAILDIAACNNQNSAAIRVSEAGIPPEYVYRYLEGQYEENRSIGSGNNQPALNKARVQKIPIPLPPKAEQEQIVTEVECRLSVIDQLEATVEANLIRVDRLRQSILATAFSGRLARGEPQEFRR